VIGNAIRVAQIVTGEAEEEYETEPEKPAKDEAAAALGRKGGAALDACNRRWGRDAVTSAAAGLPERRAS